MTAEMNVQCLDRPETDSQFNCAYTEPLLAELMFSEHQRPNVVVGSKADKPSRAKTKLSPLLPKSGQTRADKWRGAIGFRSICSIPQCRLTSIVTSMYS